MSTQPHTLGSIIHYGQWPWDTKSHFHFPSASYSSVYSFKTVRDKTDKIQFRGGQSEQFVAFGDWINLTQKLKIWMKFGKPSDKNTYFIILMTKGP